MPHQWQHTSVYHATTQPPMYRNSSRCRIRHSRHGVQHTFLFLHNSQTLGREKRRTRSIPKYPHGRRSDYANLVYR